MSTSTSLENEIKKSSKLKNSNSEEMTEMKLEGNELIQALKKQVEYYFSKENLMTDRYLVSQMNTELFVPITTIANFKMIKSLTEDKSMLIEAMKQTSSVQLNKEETMVKPQLKSQRNTIILREISSETNPEEIRAIFGDQFGKIEVKAEIGDSWYISFEDDATTLKALEHVRTQKFKGEPIRARIKTETSIRSFLATNLPPTPPVVNPVNLDPQNPYPMYPPNWVRANLTSLNYPFVNTWENQDPNFTQHNFSSENIGSGRRGQGFRGGRKGKENGRGRGHSRGGKGDSSSKKKKAPKKQQPVPSLSTTHFPPLSPTSPEKEGKIYGYTNNFIKYNKEEIVEVIQKLQNLPRPKDLKPDIPVVLEEPDYTIEVTQPFPKRTPLQQDSLAKLELEKSESEQKKEKSEQNASIESEKRQNK